MNKQTLIAEIERRISIKENLTQRPEMSDMKESLYDIIRAYQSLKSFITSLQQEQMEEDLEREFQEYWYLHQYDHRLRKQVMDGHGRAVLRNAASHFYKLGLNANKEDEK